MGRRAVAVAVAANAAAVAVAFFGACSDTTRPTDPPLAKGGVLDLSTWEFERDGPLPMNGEWLLTLRGDDDGARWSKPALVSLPGNWVNAGYPGLGRGTYSLVLRLPPSAPPLSLAKSHVEAAYTLRARAAAAPPSAEVLVIGGGVVGDDAHSERPAMRFSIGALPHDDDGFGGGHELLLTLDVSNFHYPRGGAGGAPWLGTQAQLQHRRDDARARNFFLAGFIVVVGLYHLALFGLRRSERAPLWFGLFCVLLSLRTLERGRHIEDLLPSWELWAAPKRIEFLGFYVAVVLFVAYLHALTAGGLQRHMKWAIQGSFIALSIVVVTTPPLVFGLTADLSQIIALIGIVWMVAELVRSIRRTRDAALVIVLAGFLCLGVTVVLDMLSNKDVISLIIVTPLGQSMFVAIQAGVIAMTNARARRRAEALAQELIRLSKLKDEFLANTSHELRTPLNAIINLPRALLTQFEERTVFVCAKCGEAFAAAADDDDAHDAAANACPSCDAHALRRERRRFGPDDADAVARHLEAVVGSGEQLLRVVDDILDANKLIAGNVVLSRGAHNADDIVRRALVTIEPLAAAAGVAVVVRVDPEACFYGDDIKLVQIVRHLVQNAVQFSQRGSAVDVVATRAAAGGDTVVLRVIDRGAGIAPENHALIFEPFRQVDAGHTRKHGGAGIGLALVKQLVELHRGGVVVDSALGKGTTFTVTLPAATRG